MKKLNPYLLAGILMTTYCNTSREIVSLVMPNSHSHSKINLKKLENSNKTVSINEIRDKYIAVYESRPENMKSSKFTNQYNIKEFNNKMEDISMSNSQHFYLNIDGKNGEND